MSAASWIDRFDVLSAMPPSERAMLEGAAQLVRLPKGARIFGPGQAPASYVLVLAGDIRVSQTAENGREIVLYRVMPGESCALTTACLLGGDNYNAEAVAETEAEAIALPRAVFNDMMSRSAGFRQFVLTSFGRRITDLFKLVEEIAFQRMDVRLAHKLVELADAQGEVAMTHQLLATELGTAREVVSRQLNEMQRRGWVTAGRGTLKLLDRAALERLAGSD